MMYRIPVFVFLIFILASCGGSRNQRIADRNLERAETMLKKGPEKAETPSSEPELIHTYRNITIDIPPEQMKNCSGNCLTGWVHRINMAATPKAASTAAD